MEQIKTFRFTGSESDYSQRNFTNIKTDTKTIDSTINDFIETNVNELIDIKVATVDCRYHNNGGYNSVDLIYTIIYK